VRAIIDQWLLDTVREMVENGPTGGTPRERQAWRNGACELAQYAMEHLTGELDHAGITALRHTDPGAEMSPGDPATVEPDYGVER
jgi:hypothetical protein